MLILLTKRGRYGSKSQTSKKSFPIAFSFQKTMGFSLKIISLNWSGYIQEKRFNVEVILVFKQKYIVLNEVIETKACLINWKIGRRSYILESNNLPSYLNFVSHCSSGKKCK